MNSGGLGWWAPALVLLVPPFLLLFLHLLGRLEAWMLQPDERAAVVQRLLDQVETPDELERQVTRLLSQVSTPRRARARPRPSGRRVDGLGVQDRTGRRARLRAAMSRAGAARASRRTERADRLT